MYCMLCKCLCVVSVCAQCATHTVTSHVKCHVSLAGECSVVCHWLGSAVWCVTG